jgi:hypothetical protein
MGPYGHPMMVPNQPYIHHQGGPLGNYPFFNGGNHFAYGGYQYQGGMTPGYAQNSYYQMGSQQPGFFAGPINTPYQLSAAPGLPGSGFRQPQPLPRVDPTMPAAQMTNSTGGMGCEPGYNYFFPAEHTKIHVFTSTTPPWQLPSNANIHFKACHVPCNTTLADVLKGFGCTNPVPKKNKCTEIVQGGNGRWYKGLSFQGDEKDKISMTIKQLGWDSSRNGLPTGKPVVCLWFTKD